MYYALDAEALQEASEIHIYMRKKAFEEGQQWRKAQNTVTNTIATLFHWLKKVILGF